MAIAAPYGTLVARLPQGNLDDEDFDELLPTWARAKAARYFTPFGVARRAAQLFSEHGSRRILDVGSGTGKFCIGAALARPELSLLGLEHRHQLVSIATEIGGRLELENTSFRLGNALEEDWRAFDGFFFFNPFAENIFDKTYVLDTTVELSEHRLFRELATVIRLLQSVRIGTVLITYCGLGGLIPSSYDLVTEEPAGAGSLRTWVKRRSLHADWYHLDQIDEVERTPADVVTRALGQLTSTYRETPLTEASQTRREPARHSER